MIFVKSFSRLLVAFHIKSINNVSFNTLQLVKVAKKLKKEKVNVDIINFGEEVCVTIYTVHFIGIFMYSLLPLFGRFEPTSLF